MLTVKGLTKAFGGLLAVNNLDFQVEKGEIVGLIGPNGAGKTTVFNLITGFLKPSSGKIVFDGEDITNRPPYFRARMGLVKTFQLVNIFQDFTVLENVILASYLQRELPLLGTFAKKPLERKEIDYAKELLDFVGLKDLAAVKASNLPYGHKKLLGIVLALAVRPKVLLLDEPLGGLNAEEIQRTVEVILNVWRTGVTVLLIEHNARITMEICQRIIVLSYGKKIAEGPPEHVRSDPQVIEAYLGRRRFENASD